MKKLKILLVTVFTMLLTPLTVFATEGNTILPVERNHYSELFSSAASEYLITAQPDSALILNEVTELSLNNVSINYDPNKGFVYDLPRLSAPYYYSITSKNSPVDLPNTVYPVLRVKEVVNKGASIYLNINSEATESAVATFRLVAQEQLKPCTTFVDVSEDVLESIVESDDARKLKVKTNSYDVQMHKDALVSSDLIVTANSRYWDEDTDQPESTNGEPEPMPAPPPMVGPDVQVTLHESNIFKVNAKNTAPYTINIKTMLASEINGSDNGRPEFLAVFDPNGDAVTYNANRGTVKTNKYDSLREYYKIGVRGTYALMYKGEFYLYQVANDSSAIEYSKLSEAAEGTRVIEITKGTPINLAEYINAHSLIPFFNDVNLTAPNTLLTEDFKTFIYNGEEGKEITVWDSALAYSGVRPSRAVLSVEKPADKFTLSTWYTLPDATDATLCQELELEVGTEDIPTLDQPNDPQYYTFVGWYTDTSFSTKADLATIIKNAKANSSISLYGKFEYTGGTYTVEFYNDDTLKSTKEVFKVIEKPKLPSNPSRVGYLFRNWQIVDTTASTSGTVYEPDKFIPVRDTKYTFKTFWDIKGVIRTVTINKTEYFVGEAVDKSTIVVVVQTDNNGTTKTLNTSEFTISPTHVEKVGSNQILITYMDTGSTYPVEVTGKEVAPVSITATYHGADLNVGSTINKSDIGVTLHYNNGTTKPVTDFAISPSYIQSAGTNNIRITYSNLSTVITIIGKKVETSGSGDSTGTGNTGGTGSGTGGTGNNSSNGSFNTGNTGSNNNNQSTTKAIKSISASFKGAQLYVGDTVRASDINVVATYTDNSTETISSTKFQYSPSFIRSAGMNTIIVTYAGRQTSFSINAYDKSTTPSNQPTQSQNQNNTTGVDANGNPIKNTNNNNSSNNSSNSNQNSNNSSANKKGDKLGNPLTGAGMSASEKGTSIAYLNGNNILTNKYYGGTTDLKNEVDIVDMIRSAGKEASSLTVELYNGVAGNDITKEALTLLQTYDTTLYVNMLNPDDKRTTIAKWTIIGDSLLDIKNGFNPNIGFEVTDKGTDILTSMSILDGDYPDNVKLVVYPEVSSYASGELVRLYTCDFGLTNSKMISAFTWSDDINEVTFDVQNNKRYCLSNSLAAYPNGSSLTQKIDLPSIEDEQILEGEEEQTEEEVELEDDIDIDIEDEFDFGEPEEDDGFLDQPIEPEEKKFPLGLVLGIVGALTLVGVVIGGIIVGTKMRKNKPLEAPISEDSFGDEEPIDLEEPKDVEPEQSDEFVGEDDSIEF